MTFSDYIDLALKYDQQILLVLAIALALYIISRADFDIDDDDDDDLVDGQHSTAFFVMMGLLLLSSCCGPCAERLTVSQHQRVWLEDKTVRLHCTTEGYQDEVEHSVTERGVRQFTFLENGDLLDLTTPSMARHYQVLSGMAEWPHPDELDERVGLRWIMKEMDTNRYVDVTYFSRGGEEILIEYRDARTDDGRGPEYVRFHDHCKSNNK